jgi:hypothetical protein
MESRGTGQYYYRKRRIAGKVQSEYLGTGYAATLMQLLDEHERQEAQERRQAWQATVDAETELDAMLDGFTEVVNAYAGTMMLVSGYHTYKRQWRKKSERSRRNQPIV